MPAELIKRITVDPNICHGRPSIRGMRYSVEMMLKLMSQGMTVDEILEDYVDLQKEDILACIEYAARQN